MEKMKIDGYSKHTHTLTHSHTQTRASPPPPPPPPHTHTRKSYVGVIMKWLVSQTGRTLQRQRSPFPLVWRTTWRSTAVSEWSTTASSPTWGQPTAHPQGSSPALRYVASTSLPLHVDVILPFVIASCNSMQVTRTDALTSRMLPIWHWPRGTWHRCVCGGGGGGGAEGGKPAWHYKIHI